MEPSDFILRGRIGRASRDSSGFDPGVVNKNIVVRLKSWMKCHTEQAAIAPALTLGTDVEQKLLLRYLGRVVESPDTAFAFPDRQSITAWDRPDSQRIRKK